MSEFIFRVPATSANLGPGFDSYGLALKFFNKFSCSLSKADELIYSPNSCVDLTGAPSIPSENLFFQSADRFYQALGKTRSPLSVEIEAHIPLARGLGSSSSVIVAGLFAANQLEGSPLSNSELVTLATEIEGHPDNVAPAILGGVILADSSTQEVYSLHWPEDWHIMIVVPSYRLLTEQARSVLPSHIPMRDAIFNVQKASLLTYALLKQDEKAFRDSLADRLHQPYRSTLIPEFEPIQKIALANGAFGAVISGAGPSIAIFYPKSSQAGLLNALKIWKEFKILSLEVSSLGAHRLDQKLESLISL